MKQINKNRSIRPEYKADAPAILFPVRFYRKPLAIAIRCSNCSDFKRLDTS